MKNLYEYLILINLSKELERKILSIKKVFGNKYNNEHALHSRPHISLLDFLQPKENEEKIIQELRQFCDKVDTFEINLFGYGFFPNDKIYIGVPDKYMILSLAGRALTMLKKKNLIIKKKFEKTIEPFVTIARKLNTEQFTKAVSEYTNKYFKAEFVSDNITLLGRPHEENRKDFRWEVSYNFKFGKERLKVY